MFRWNPCLNGRNNTPFSNVRFAPKAGIGAATRPLTTTVMNRDKRVSRPGRQRRRGGSLLTWPLYVENEVAAAQHSLQSNCSRTATLRTAASPSRSRNCVRYRLRGVTWRSSDSIRPFSFVVSWNGMLNTIEFTPMWPKE